MLARMMKLIASIVTAGCMMTAVYADQYGEEASKAAREMSGAIKGGGDMKWMIDRMYPPRKKQLLKNFVGGEAAFMKQLQQATEQMKKIEFTIKKFVIGAPQGEFLVNFKKEVIVFLPTTMEFSFKAPDGRVHTMQRISYLIAIKSLQKNTDPWYFLDGKDMSTNILREMFYDLPENVKLPPTSEKVVQ